MKVSIYCGDSLETWSPKSVASGIGGSEEAVINMSRELAKRGHQVRVWNNCGDDAGVHDGVTFSDYLDFVDEPVDIFISWRTESNLKYAKNFGAAYHWLHDTVEEDRVLAALGLGASKIMVLSDYHRRLYPKIRNQEVFLTQNGVDLRHFERMDVSRVPGRIFYGSSYDRGLKEFLEEWPKIKLAVPHATLHIAYGWQTWEAIARANDSMETFKRVKDTLVQLMQQDGITELGRISHADVAKEMLEADVWGYPTWWPEISCITAMKAQIAGAIPVVIPTAAVAETVQYGRKTDCGYYMDIDGNPAVRTGETLDQWTQQLINTLTLSADQKDGERDAMMQWARKKFDWATIAAAWEQEFLAQLTREQIRLKNEPKVKGYADAL